MTSPSVAPDPATSAALVAPPRYRTKRLYVGRHTLDFTTCLTCGAVVAKERTHTDWHAKTWPSQAPAQATTNDPTEPPQPAPITTPMEAHV